MLSSAVLYGDYSRHCCVDDRRRLCLVVSRTRSGWKGGLDGCSCLLHQSNGVPECFGLVGMGNVLKWWTVALIAAEIAALISAKTSISGIHWFSWAQERSSKVYYGLWGTTFAALRFVITLVAVPNCALNAEPYLASPLLLEVKRYGGHVVIVRMPLTDMDCLCISHFYLACVVRRLKCKTAFNLNVRKDGRSVPVALTEQE